MTLYTTVKTVVVAPIPSAMVSSAAAAKPGLPPELAHPVADVLKERVDQVHATRGAQILFDCRRDAEVAPCGAPRVRRAQASRFVLGRELVQVEVHLVIELLLERSAPQAARAETKRIEPAHDGVSQAFFRTSAMAVESRAQSCCSRPSCFRPAAVRL